MLKKDEGHDPARALVRNKKAALNQKNHGEEMKKSQIIGGDISRMSCHSPHRAQKNHIVSKGNKQDHSKERKSFTQ